MSKIQDKINHYMDQIQVIMEANTHLEKDSDIHKLMESVSIYFSHMDDENADYYQMVQYVLEEKMNWEINK
jgi:hypothetical protein|tara:strand:+ start:813 stop:1025 length:213 start_codon:yes stop_codon:yes gene_type:complete